jgi:signal transduction histidine kinase
MVAGPARRGLAGRRVRPSANRASRIAAPRYWRLPWPRGLGLAVTLVVALAILEARLESRVVLLPAYTLPVVLAALASGTTPGIGVAVVAFVARLLVELDWVGRLPGYTLQITTNWGLLAANLVAALASGRLRTLYRTAGQQAQVSSALLRIAQVISDASNIDLVLRAVADSSTRLLRADYAATFRWEESAQQFVAAQQVTSGNALPKFSTLRIAPDVAPSLRAMVESRSVTAIEDANALLPLERAREMGLRHGVLAPFVSWGKVTGFLILATRSPWWALSETDVQVLEGLGSQAATALENHAAFAQLEERAREVSLLLQVSRDVSSTLDMTHALRQIASGAGHMVQGAAAAVGLCEGAIVRFREMWVGGTWVAFERVIDGALAEPAQERGLTLTIPTRLEGVPLVLQPLDRVLVPILGPEGGLGVLDVYRQARPGRFRAEEVRLLQGFANQASIAISNARLFAELQERNRRLLEAERLRDDLTSMVVHDLRTPLTGVITALQTAREAGDPELSAEMEAMALENAQTLLRMVNDILDIARMEAGELKLERESVAPDQVIAAALAQVDPLAKAKRISVACETAPETPPVSADEDYLRRTLINLLGNALKFTGSGGRVCVRAGLNDAGMVRFAVEDTGEGIPPEMRQRIFDKFGQAETRMSGARKVSTGLGLTFCKLAVEAHGGAIGVESEPGKGSTFWFTLPVAGGNGETGK